MMRRVNRRVGHGDQVPSALKRMTFDRTTFVECSQRMRRIVPTLGRQKNNADGHATGSSDESAKETNSTNVILSKGKDARAFLSLPPASTTSSVPTELLYSDLDLSSDEDENAGGVTIIENGSADLVLSRTRTRSDADVTVEDRGPSVSVSSSVTIQAERAAAATLPAKLEAPREEPSSIRQIFFKPFTRFASLMSTIDVGCCPY